jgi:hypothetical protein
MLEIATNQIVSLGHEINPEHWTPGEGGLSNVCLNCGLVIGVTKNGDLWGTALNGPCPDRRYQPFAPQRPAQRRAIQQQSTLREQSLPQNDLKEPQVLLKSKARPGSDSLKGFAIVVGTLAVLLVSARLSHSLAALMTLLSAVTCGVALFCTFATRRALLVALPAFICFIVFIHFFNSNVPPQRKAESETTQLLQKAREAQSNPPSPIPATHDVSSAQQAPPAQQGLPITRADNVALLGAALTQQLKKDGSDVVIVGDRDTLIFDCTKALDPRSTCYVLYKTYPSNKDELKVLQLMGVRKLKFKTEKGIFSGFTWEKDIQ